MPRPGVTLVITTVGKPRRHYLARALESAWKQTVEPDVIVISQDNARLGAAFTRESGTDCVQTSLVAYLDDDDELYPHHLELLVECLYATDADLVFPWFDVRGGNDPFPGHEGLPWFDDDPRQVPVTFVARTESIRKAGGWVTDWDPNDPQVDADGNRAGEDYQLILRMVGLGMRIVHLPTRTWAWHHDSGNSSGLPSRIDWGYDG